MVEDSREMAHIPYSSVVNRVGKMHTRQRKVQTKCVNRCLLVIAK